MSNTLTQLITRVQVQLRDDGTRFDSNLVTSAVRSALTKVNLRIPIYRRVEITAVSDQLTYSLTDAASDATFCLDVLLKDSDGEYHTPLDFTAYNEENEIYFRLAAPQDASQKIIVLYSALHTVNGLDSATTSTLSDALDQVLVDGATAESLAIRAAGITEDNLLDKNAPNNYRNAMISFLRAFELGLSASQTPRASLSLPRFGAWNDEWHNFYQ